MLSINNGFGIKTVINMEYQNGNLEKLLKESRLLGDRKWGTSGGTGTKTLGNDPSLITNYK